jgi:hypothetical protein
MIPNEISYVLDLVTLHAKGIFFVHQIAVSVNVDGFVM